MASPFAVFRRNQKMLLAVVCILAMVAFVFLDPLMRYVGANRQPQNPVVVETVYGPLTESDLAGIRASRELVDVFLRAISMQTVQSLMQKGNQIDPRMADREAEQFYMYWHNQLLGRSKPTPEESAVETLVLSKKAQQMGMVVSDRAINDLLKQITAESLTNQEIQEVIGSLRMGRTVNAKRLFDAIRTEMLASQLSQTFARSINDIPPAQRFEYYARLNRRAKAEVMPLAVADFVGKVGDPKPEELQAFYEKHKDEFPDPTSPEPGFKQPKRAAFQYFKADFAKFRDAAKPEVTDQEIAEYYEKNKAQFRQIDLPKDENEAEKTEQGAKAEGESKDAAPAPELNAEKPAEPNAEKPEASKTQEPRAEQPKAEEPKADKPAETNPPAAPEAEQTPADKPDQTFNNAQKDVIRFASAGQLADGATVRLVSEVRDEPAADQAGAAPQEEKPAAAEAAKPVENKPADAAKPGDAPALPENAPEAKPGAETNEKPAEGAKEAAQQEPKQEEPKEEIKYEPLEKVKDTIRDNIAAQKASKQIGEIFDDLSAEMRRYSDELDVYETRKETDKQAVKPKLFPFAELAKAKGVEAKELPLVTADEAAHEDIGQVSRVVADRRTQFGFRREPFTEFAFAESLPLYRPTTVEDNDGNVYLFWKSAEEPAYVPTLEQIKDKVTLAWKMNQARDLALEAAKKYAGEARAAKKSLKDTFASQSNLKVIETNSFSWMTVGNVPLDPMSAQPRISAVDDLQNIGAEFMSAVFNLQPGEVTTAMNHPEDTAYVIRLVEYDRPIDELRKDFAAEPMMRYMSVAQPDQRRMYMAWLSDLNRDAGVHWIRQADIARTTRAPAEAQPESDDQF